MTTAEPGTPTASQTSGLADDPWDGSDVVRGGPTLTLANEFTEVHVTIVHTRNGARLLIESPKSGRAVHLCPIEVEALTWQSGATFTALVGKPGESLVTAEAP